MDEEAEDIQYVHPKCSMRDDVLEKDVEELKKDIERGRFVVSTRRREYRLPIRAGARRWFGQ